MTYATAKGSANDCPNPSDCVATCLGPLAAAAADAAADAADIGGTCGEEIPCLDVAAAVLCLEECVAGEVEVEEEVEEPETDGGNGQDDNVGCIATDSDEWRDLNIYHPSCEYCCSAADVCNSRVTGLACDGTITGCAAVGSPTTREYYCY